MRIAFGVESGAITTVMLFGDLRNRAIGWFQCGRDGSDRYDTAFGRQSAGIRQPRIDIMHSPIDAIHDQIPPLVQLVGQAAGHNAAYQLVAIFGIINRISGKVSRWSALCQFAMQRLDDVPTFANLAQGLFQFGRELPLSWSQFDNQAETFELLQTP